MCFIENFIIHQMFDIAGINAYFVNIQLCFYFLCGINATSFLSSQHSGIKCFQKSHIRHKAVEHELGGEYYFNSNNYKNNFLNPHTINIKNAYFILWIISTMILYKCLSLHWRIFSSYWIEYIFNIIIEKQNANFMKTHFLHTTCEILSSSATNQKR